MIVCIRYDDWSSFPIDISHFNSTFVSLQPPSSSEDPIIKWLCTLFYGCPPRSSSVFDTMTSSWTMVFRLSNGLLSHLSVASLLPSTTSVLDCSSIPGRYPAMRPPTANFYVNYISNVNQLESEYLKSTLLIKVRCFSLSLFHAWCFHRSIKVYLHRPLRQRIFWWGRWRWEHGFNQVVEDFLRRNVGLRFTSSIKHLSLSQKVQGTCVALEREDTWAGFTFWRLSFQVPLSLVCPRHLDWSFCVLTILSQAHFSAPSLQWILVLSCKCPVP